MDRGPRYSPKQGSHWYSRVPNKHRPTFINFGSFFQGLRSYLRQLHYYLGVYVYCFSQFFPGSTLIWGPTLIRNSRVCFYNSLLHCSTKLVVCSLFHIVKSARRLNEFQSSNANFQCALELNFFMYWIDRSGCY